MKRDIKLYNYHTDCPNCNGFNTRLNPALNLEYAICYSCSLIFKPNNSEIEKMRTPFPIEMAVHKDFENVSKQELDYIKEVYKVNSSLKSNNIDILNKEIENQTNIFLNKNEYQNIIIFSNFSTDRKIKNCTIISENNLKDIEKVLYTKVLKNGKIDCVVFENISNIILSEILNKIKDALAFNAIITIYSPIVDNIYNNFISFIKNNKYFYNIYTIFREFNKIYFNIFEYNRLNNFNQLVLKNGSNDDWHFNNKLNTISKQDHRNIMYSEPLTIIE